MLRPITLRLTVPRGDIPPWVREIVVDESGNVAGYDCELYWNTFGSGGWVTFAISQRVVLIGKMFPVPPEIARRLHFRVEHAYLETDP